MTDKNQNKILEVRVWMRGGMLCNQFQIRMDDKRQWNGDRGRRLFSRIGSTDKRGLGQKEATSSRIPAEKSDDIAKA
jgi:hypothetical protein